MLNSEWSVAINAYSKPFQMEMPREKWPLVVAAG